MYRNCDLSKEGGIFVSRNNDLGCSDDAASPVFDFVDIVVEALELLVVVVGWWLFTFGLSLSLSLLLLELYWSMATDETYTKGDAVG